MSVDLAVIGLVVGAAFGSMSAAALGLSGVLAGAVIGIGAISGIAWWWVSPLPNRTRGPM